MNSDVKLNRNLYIYNLSKIREGYANINFEKIQVYPNPTNELIVIELPFSMIKKGCNISVRNTVGEEVFKSTNLKQNLYIDTKNWGAKGLYFIDISDDKQNRISINKIIVQ
jgi:hypothetical protein